MRFNIGFIGKFNLFYLAKESYGRNFDKHVYTGHPEFRLWGEGVLFKQIETVSNFYGLYIAGLFSGSPGRPSVDWVMLNVLMLDRVEQTLTKVQPLRKWHIYGEQLVANHQSLLA